MKTVLFRFATCFPFVNDLQRQSRCLFVCCVPVVFVGAEGRNGRQALNYTLQFLSPSFCIFISIDASRTYLKGYLRILS